MEPEVNGDDGLIAVEMAEEILEGATRVGDAGAQESANTAVG
jgi:hypothetical protein